jgi:sulfur-carrier protein
LITINLLGGARKAIGKSSVILEKHSTSIQEVLEFLKENAVATPHFPEGSRKTTLDYNNILITINGVESTILGGTDTSIQSGDVVTIVTVVHGG